MPWFASASCPGRWRRRNGRGGADVDALRAAGDFRPAVCAYVRAVSEILRLLEFADRQREFRRRIKNRLDAEGIRTPAPRTQVKVQVEPGMTATANS